MSLKKVCGFFLLVSPSIYSQTAANKLRLFFFCQFNLPLVSAIKAHLTKVFHRQSKVRQGKHPFNKISCIPEQNLSFLICVCYISLVEITNSPAFAILETHNILADLCVCFYTYS